MGEPLKTTRDEQKETWNRVAGSWKKWDQFTMNFLRPTGDAIIKALDIRVDDIVLDIASGTGEPAFSIAEIAKKGKVFATDLSEEMLAIAHDNAKGRNIKNVEFKVADVSDLPFNDDFFHKISCRMGFMFFPDMQLAAEEMFRVCRTGGRVSIGVWAAAEYNDWFTTMTKVLSKHIELKPAPAGAPGMFRCAKPGFAKQILENAGFKNVHEQNIPGLLDFGTAENYWMNRTEMSEPMVKLMSELDESTREKIKSDLVEVCGTMLRDGKLLMNYCSLVVSAEK